MSGCLGAAVAALVDGELDHAGRERVHRHLAHCLACRDEVEAQRRTKARLRTASAPDPSDALLARLSGLGAPLQVDAASAPDVAPEPVPPAPAGELSPPWRPAADGARTGQGPRVSAPSVRRRQPRGAGAASRLSPRATGRVRRASAGSAVALLGVSAALALGAPPQRATPTPVEPGGAALASDAAARIRVPSPAYLRTASTPPFVPALRIALLPAASTDPVLPVTGAPELGP